MKEKKIMPKQNNKFEHRGVEIRFLKIIEIANVKENEKILDLGCGKDMLLRLFLPNVDYIGIDKNGGDIKFDCEKGLPPEVKRQKFDVIFMNEFIEHIENFKSLLRSCKDILTGNGRIVVSTPSGNRILYGDFFDGIGEEPTHIHCFRKSNMRNLARICNLKITATEGTYIRFPPLLRKWIAIPTKQTIYTEIVIYRFQLMKNEKEKDDTG